MWKRRRTNCETMIRRKNTYEAEGLEAKLRRMTETKEPIENFWPTVYTNKADGVLPGYDIRSDRFDIAMEAVGKVRSYELAQMAKGGDMNPGVKENAGGEKGAE